MTYKKLYEDALFKLEHNKITLGEFEKMIKPLEREVEQEPCEDCIFKKEWERIGKLLSVILEKHTKQESTIKALGEELRKARKGIADEKVLIGYNMAVAICNKHLGEREVEK